jgi:hypothetical protein
VERIPRHATNPDTHTFAAAADAPSSGLRSDIVSWRGGVPRDADTPRIADRRPQGTLRHHPANDTASFAALPPCTPTPQARFVLPAPFPKRRPVHLRRGDNATRDHGVGWRLHGW